LDTESSADLSPLHDSDRSISLVVGIALAQSRSTPDGA
jgi:hypothetical protein